MSLGPLSLERRAALWTGVIVAGPLGVVTLGALALAAGGGPPPADTTPSAEALADIPGDYLAHYQQAALAHDLDWAVLAGVGKVECNHGRSQLEGCNPPGTVNSAGARGPMQFLGSTWRDTAGTFDLDVSGPPIPTGSESSGYATDGNNDGNADPWEPADATWAAARLLHANGAPANYETALWAYNHSDTYRSDVLGWADTYRTAATATTAPVEAPGGPVALATVRGITVNAAIAPQVEALLAAAQADGLALTGGGYRSPDQQIALRREHCGTSDYAIYEMPASDCSPPTARPGTSMHEQGLAIDFDNCSSHGTACWQWLNTHAATFGFHNLPSEPWHWSTTGR